MRELMGFGAVCITRQMELKFDQPQGSWEKRTDWARERHTAKHLASCQWQPRIGLPTPGSRHRKMIASHREVQVQAPQPTYTGQPIVSGPWGDL